MQGKLQVVKKSTRLSDQAYKIIKDSIMKNQLKPGEVLPPRGTAVPYPILVTSDAESLQTTLLARDVDAGPIEVVQGVRFFTFWDPDGNRLEACQVLAGS